MSAISVFTTKGGSGKTTAAINIATILGSNSKVIFIELDQNFSVSSIYNLKENVRFYDIVHGSEEKYVKKYNVDIISSDARTLLIDSEIGRGEISIQNIKEVIERIGKKYDYVVIDCHNSPSHLILTVLSLSDVVLLPIVPSLSGVSAYVQSKKIVEKVEVKILSFGSRIHKGIFGISSAEKEIIEKVRKYRDFSGVLIPYDKKVIEAESKHQPVVIYAPKSPASRALNELVKKIKEVI